jgi:hypothetical protein
MQGISTRKSQLLIKFCNRSRHGAGGIHNEASRATIENEFGTSDDNEAILRILDQGEIQENIVRIIPLFKPRRIPALT